eukprot:scaffold4672_cov78-Skeletonema_dohrnii-CCMP3373.AAC.4
MGGGMPLSGRRKLAYARLLRKQLYVRASGALMQVVTFSMGASLMRTCREEEKEEAQSRSHKMSAIFWKW